MKHIAEKLPIAINNFYACTIPQSGKAHAVEENIRINRALHEIKAGLMGKGA